MTFRLIGLSVVIVLYMFDILRPMSCRIAVSASKDNSQRSDSRMEFACFKKCRQLQSVVPNVPALDRGYKNCLKRCIARQYKKEAILDDDAKKNFNLHRLDDFALRRIRRKANQTKSVTPTSVRMLVAGSKCKPRTDCRGIPRDRSPNSTVYPGSADVFRVACKKAGNFSKTSFVVYWEEPKGYQNSLITHFQVLFIVKRKNVIFHPVEDLCCYEVKRDEHSYEIRNVDVNDTLDIVILPYPRYVSIDMDLQSFQPCVAKPKSSPTAKIPTSTTKCQDQNPLDIAVSIPITIVAMLSLAVGLIIYRRKKPPLPAVSQGKVYVSYYADSEEYHSSLVNLVAKLRSTFSIDLIMDSYCQTEVAELGLARWCQKKLSESTKIVMVVSKEYLKICEDWQKGPTDILELVDVNVSRVSFELQYIINHIFEQRNNSLLTIILADVNHGALPDPFRGMKTFQWPGNEEQEHVLASSICGQEAIET